MSASGIYGCLLLPQRIGTERFYVSSEPGHHLHEARSFRRRNPFHPEPVRIDTAVLEHYFDSLFPGIGLVVTFKIMAFAQVTANPKDTVSPLGQGMHNDVRIDHSGTHKPDYAQVRRILQSTDPSQVSSGKSSPNAQKSYDDRLIIIRHRGTPFYEIRVGWVEQYGTQH
jgi:hypothetical protein